MDLLQKIEERLAPANACKFKIGKQLKRMDGDWDIRYDWVLYDANDRALSHSEWEGFETLVEAMEDMYKHIE